MSHPDGLPDLFLDRSLGRIRVPGLLRAAGIRLITLAECYGVPADERVADTEWLTLAGDRGWIAVMKDDRIRYVAAERDALVASGVRALVITNASLSADEMVRRVLRALPGVAEICAERPGPFLFALQENRIEEIALDR